MARLDQAYLGMVVSDQLVAKAMMISEVSQIAKAELRVRRYLEDKWNIRKEQAAKAAYSATVSGKKSTQVASAVGAVMNKWAGDVLPTFNAEISEVYRLARIAGHKKATKQTKNSLQFNIPKTEGDTETVVKATAKGAPAFDLVDEEAVEALKGKNTFWVGNHYNTNLSDSIRDTARTTMVESGVGTVAAGKVMRNKVRGALSKFVTPGGFIGTEKQYFEGLVANSMTVGRVYGQMRSFAEIGIRKYTIVNPGGTRICDVCSAVQGKTFTVKQGLAQIQKEFLAKKPEDIKTAHPWPRSAKTVAGKSSKELSDAGLSLPPYHFRCRCTVDVSDEIGSFSDLKPVAFPSSSQIPTLPKPKTPVSPLSKPPKAPKPVKPKVPTTPKKPYDPDEWALTDMKDGVVVASESVGFGVNDAQFVTLKAKSGREIEVVWKASKNDAKNLRSSIADGTFHKREKAMYALDKELGGKTIIPPTITRKLGKDGVGSMQLVVDDAHDMLALTPEVNVAIKGGEFVANANARRMFLLDVIGANDDRNVGNVMIRIKAGMKAAQKGALTPLAIDNGLAFPNGPIHRFLMPMSDDLTGKAYLTLDKGSIKLVKSLKPARLAKILKESGIEKEAAKHTLIRVEALKGDPGVISKMGLGGDSPRDKVIKFVNKSVFDSEKVLPKGALKRINTALDKAYK